MCGLLLLPSIYQELGIVISFSSMGDGTLTRRNEMVKWKGQCPALRLGCNWTAVRTISITRLLHSVVIISLLFLSPSRL